MSEFRLCKKLGLEVLEYSNLRVNSSRQWIGADDVEALLSKGVRVRAYTGPAARPGGMWIDYGQHDADSDKEALLIGIRPVVRDTAEGLLRELVQRGLHFANDSLIERARRLLADK